MTHPPSHHPLLVSESKPPSVITVFVDFYRHFKSPHSFAFIIHSRWGNYYYYLLREPRAVVCAAWQHIIFIIILVLGAQHKPSEKTKKKAHKIRQLKQCT